MPCQELLGVGDSSSKQGAVARISGVGTHYLLAQLSGRVCVCATSFLSLPIGKENWLHSVCQRRVHSKHTTGGKVQSMPAHFVKHANHRQAVL